MIAIVFSDADNLESSPRIRKFVCNVLSYGIAAPKKEPSHGLVDDADMRPAFTVLRADLAAHKHRDS